MIIVWLQIKSCGQPSLSRRGRVGDMCNCYWTESEDFLIDFLKIDCNDYDEFLNHK